ncbi:MAG: hypothetical protein IPI44_24015 [Sulfuritalea sp.]|nr:hypothetical protein [Sulfuritalea sp.]
MAANSPRLHAAGDPFALGLGLPSWIWLAGFTILLLIFWRTDRSRVPLYLSSVAAS